MQTGPPSAKLSVPLFSASRLGQRRSRLSFVYRWGRAPERWSRLLSHCRECEVPAERHIAANKDPVSTSEREPHGLVMAVSEPNGEARSVHLGLKIEHAEHLHAVR